MSLKDPIKDLNTSKKLIDSSVTDDDLIETGYGNSRISNSHYFTTQELLICSVLGVMGGVISGLIPFSLLVKTWYPLVGGTQLVSGHHILWAVIAYGLTKKKLSIFLTCAINGFLGFLLGSPWGIGEVLFYLYEGFFLFLGFVIVGLFKEGETKLGWGIAAGIGNLSQVPLFWIITGKIYILPIALFIMSCMFAFVSGVFMAGITGKIVVERLEKANI